MAELVVKKKVANGVLYTNGMIRIDNVRASYPHLAKPYAGKNDSGGTSEPKFSIVALLDKKTHVAVKDLIKEAIEDLLKENKGAKVAADKRFLKNGDDSDKEEYEGMFTVSARETKRPAVRGRDNAILPTEEIADTVYAGCYVDVLIRPWYQNNDYGKRINAGIVGVKFRKDGEPFGEGRIDDTDAWDDSEDEGGFEDDGDL